MIYEFNEEIVTEEVLEEKIYEEVRKASINSYALASYILAHNENINSFEELYNNNLNSFDEWVYKIIEEEIFNDFVSVNDFNELGYNSEEELEENLKCSTVWKMDWYRTLLQLM